MSLPSLSTVLRGILPGSPPYKERRERSGHGAAAAAGGGGGLTPAAAPGGAQPDLTPTPEAGSQQSETSGGYRRRREEVDSISEIESLGGGSVFSDNSCSTAAYGAGGGGSWGGDSSDYESGGPSSDYEGMQQQMQQLQQQRGAGAGASSPSVGAIGAGAYGMGSGCTSKRAKLTSRSLSRLSDEAVNGMGIMEGRDMVSGGARGRGSLVRSMSALDGGGGGQRGGRVFEQSMSHSTEEWRAMSKAGRVLGVDSLEERDVEDQRRASSVKAARILGVENVAELQLQLSAASATGERQKWAPPRSSASKAARMLGVKDPDAQEDEGRGRGRGRKPTTKTALRRSKSLSSRGAKDRSGSKPKPRQGGITSLILALEINGGSEAGSTSQNGSSENGDCSSLDYNGNEDLPHKKGGGGKQETGSNRSTRATESCSSVSDLAHTDPDAVSCHGGSSREGGTSVSGLPQDEEQQQKQQQQQQQHTRLQAEVSDDSQLVGLQTPSRLSSSAAGPDGLRGFSRHTRGDDDMDMLDIETPLSQPRSAALTSLRNPPAPLLAPYTPSLASAPAAAAAVAASPSPEPAGLAASPSGSLQPHQHQQQQQQQHEEQQGARHASDFALGENGRSWPSPSPSVGAVAEGKSGGSMTSAEEKLSGRVARVSEVLDDSPSASSIGERERDGFHGGGGWTRDWSRASAAAQQQQQQQQHRPSSAPFDGRVGGSSSGFRLPEPIPSSSPSPWGTAAAAAAAAAPGCKEPRPNNWSEYKLESPVAPRELRGRELPLPEAYAGAASAACDEKRGRWSNGGVGSSPHSRHQLSEYKHEPADVALLSTANGWEHRGLPAQPVGLVSSGAAGVYPYPHPQFRHHQFQHQQWQQQQQQQQQHQQQQQQQQQHQQQQHQHQHQQHAMAAGSFSPLSGYQVNHHQRHHHQHASPSSISSSPSPARVTMSPVVNGRDGRDGGGGGVAGYGFPLASVGGSESSGDSDSMCDTFPDRMDEGEGPAPSSAFEALAAMIPVVNPMGIARQQMQHPVRGGGGRGGGAAAAGHLIKVEDLGVDTAAAAAGRAKVPKPRQCRVNGGGGGGAQGAVPVVHSPLVSSGGRGFAKAGARKNMAAGAGAVSSPSTAGAVAGGGGGDDGTAGGGGGGGISTRKQQEVATRPREKGRFVKRAPAFLPISAFKPASDRNEAAEAAEAAEEARQKADEAAAVAAAAAAAAAAQERLEREKAAAPSTPTSSTSNKNTNMMPPPAAVTVTARGEKGGDGDGDGAVASSSAVVVGEKKKDQHSHDGAIPAKAGSSSATTTKPSTAAAASRRVGGGGGATRGRGERRMASPASRAANDIWFGEGEDSLMGDGDGTGGGEGNFGAGCARDHSVSSDGGSERGSEAGGELRGMAFLPCSPMDRNSPGSGVHGRSSSAWDSPSPRRSGGNGGGSSARRGSGSGKSGFMSMSVSVSSASSSCSSSSFSPMCSPPISGGVLLSAPLLSDVPVGSGRVGGGAGGRSSEKP